jgi:hypothetical protein
MLVEPRLYTVDDVWKAITPDTLARQASVSYQGSNLFKPSAVEGGDRTILTIPLFTYNMYY